MSSISSIPSSVSFNRQVTKAVDALCEQIFNLIQVVIQRIQELASRISSIFTKRKVSKVNQKNPLARKPSMVHQTVRRQSVTQKPSQILSTSSQPSPTSSSLSRPVENQSVSVVLNPQEERNQKTAVSKPNSLSNISNGGSGLSSSPTTSVPATITADSEPVQDRQSSAPVIPASSFDQSKAQTKSDGNFDSHPDPEPIQSLIRSTEKQPNSTVLNLKEEAQKSKKDTDLLNPSVRGVDSSSSILASVVQEEQGSNSTRQNKTEPKVAYKLNEKTGETSSSIGFDLDQAILLSNQDQAPTKLATTSSSSSLSDPEPIQSLIRSTEKQSNSTVLNPQEDRTQQNQTIGIPVGKRLDVIDPYAIDFSELQCEEDQQKAISYILSNTATKGNMRLCWCAEKLVAHKKKIENIHSLQFLSIIFNDSNLKANIQTIFEDNNKRASFLNGATGFLRSFLEKLPQNLTQHFTTGFSDKINQLQDKNLTVFNAYLNGFIESIYSTDQIAEHREELISLAEKKDWEKFIQYLIDHPNC